MGGRFDWMSMNWGGTLNYFEYAHLPLSLTLIRLHESSPPLLPWLLHLIAERRSNEISPVVQVARTSTAPTSDKRRASKVGFQNGRDRFICWRCTCLQDFKCHSWDKAQQIGAEK